MKLKLIALAAYVAVVPAHAVDLEVGFGETHYIKHTDGVWYQDAFPYWMDTKDQNLSLGISWKPSNIRYRAEFLVLGKHFVNGLATSDGTYNPHFVTHCGDSCGLVAFQGREPHGPDRWKNRSRTYQGIAEAFADQWGKL